MNAPIIENAISPATEVCAESAQPSVGALFGAFFLIGLTGFGGVLPWARRMLIERRGWLGEREFTDLLPLAQLLPGPNVSNLATIVGRRFHGPAGAAAAVKA